MSIPASKQAKQATRIVEPVALDASGRIVVPANIRKAAGMRPGQRMTISLFGEAPNQLVKIQTIECAIARAQAHVRKVLKGRKVSAVDEFIAERRAEANMEN